jgi:uncharacterized Zn-finger protein
MRTKLIALRRRQMTSTNFVLQCENMGMATKDPREYLDIGELTCNKTKIDD